MRVSGFETAFLPLHAGDGRALLRRTERSVPESGGDILIGVGSGKDRCNLLCRGLDTALQRCPDYPLGSDSAVAAWKYRTAGRRHSGIARARIDSGFDGCSYALRYSAR